MPQFTASTELKCSAAALREYLGQTEKLPTISNPDLQLKVISAPEMVAADTEIEFQITAYGLKQTMKHRYTVADEGRIVAEQTDGPTRSWVHTQTIEETENGCILTDIIDFEPPGGMVGFVMTEARIRESLEEGMEFRYDALAEILE